MNKSPSKPATIKASELNRAPGNVLRRVAVNKEQIIIERGGYPIAIISPYEVGRERAVQLLEELTRELEPQAKQLGLSEAQVVSDVRETRKALRRKRNGKTSA